MNLALKFLFVAILLLVVILQIFTLWSSRQRSEIVKVCPTGAISMQGSKAVIDSDKCIGCQRCVLGIPVPQSDSRESASSAAIVDQLPEAEARASQSVQQIPEKPAQVAQAIAKPDASVTPVKAKESIGSQSNNTSKPVTTKKAYSVDPKTCIGCQLCVSVCPTKAISMSGGKAVIDKDKCINCGICANGDNNDYTGCPVQAIKAP